MDALTIVTGTALLLIAIGISDRDNGSWVILTGFAMAAVAVMIRLFSGDGLIQIGIELLRDCGISLLIASAYMAVRKLAEHARPYMILGMASLILSGLLFGAQYLWQTVWNHETLSVLVELGLDDSIEEVEGILTQYADAWEQAFPTVAFSDDRDLSQIYLVHVSESHVHDMMSALRADAENIDHVELNKAVQLFLPPSEQAIHPTSKDVPENDPLVDLQWALDAVQGHEALQVLKLEKPQRRARIAIVDTGVESDHEDLEMVYVKGVHYDGNGHGTHCAGLAGATTNNGLGIASLNWEGRFVELMGFRALSESGHGSLEQIAQAVIDAVQANADVISMSLGLRSDEEPRVLFHAVEFALERGVIVVASSGNSNEDALGHYPSSIEDVIAIAAVDQTLSKATFSNTVGNLSRPLAAPGVDIHSTFHGGDYETLSGTSMATPIVAGLVAVMLSINPKLTSDDIYTILHETGREISDTPLVGRLINAENAIERAKNIHI
ncbi:MAG: S8 family serine peptidase [Bacteroidetes bacterium]|nr:S8 family serine peptidase [Bacteroidota bacterium]